MCSIRRRAGFWCGRPLSDCSPLGHNPTIAIRCFKGEARFDPEAPESASLQFEIDTSSLVVTGEVNEKDRHEMERAMREDVLETDRYPEIPFVSSSVEAARITEGMFHMKIAGALTLHDATRDLEIPCNVIVAACAPTVNSPSARPITPSS